MVGCWLHAAWGMGPWRPAGPAVVIPPATHAGMGQLCALLLRVRGAAPLRTELRAAAAEVHAVLTGAELGLLDLPPTARDGPHGEQERDGALPVLASALRRLSAAGGEVFLGGRPGKSAAWAPPHRTPIRQLALE